MAAPVAAPVATLVAASVAAPVAAPVAASVAGPVAAFGSSAGSSAGNSAGRCYHFPKSYYRRCYHFPESWTLTFQSSKKWRQHPAPRRFQRRFLSSGNTCFQTPKSGKLKKVAPQVAPLLWEYSLGGNPPRQNTQIWQSTKPGKKWRPFCEGIGEQKSHKKYQKTSDGLPPQESQRDIGTPHGGFSQIFRLNSYGSISSRLGCMQCWLKTWEIVFSNE